MAGVDRKKLGGRGFKEVVSVVVLVLGGYGFREVVNVVKRKVLGRSEV